MKITVLGSGSRGNAFAVTAAGVTVLLDAGFGPRTLAKRAAAAGVDLETIVGIVLTHEHGDHARGAPALARRTGCAVYGSRGTLSALRSKLRDVRMVPVACHTDLGIGPFTLHACRTTHDANEPIALRLTGPHGDARVGLAYDLGRPTAATRYLLREVECLLLEANHDELMLRMGSYPPVVRDRIGGSRGHLSNRAAGQLLADLCHDHLRAVVLVHLSEQCNTPELAEREVRACLDGRRFPGRLHVARQDTPLAPIDLAAGPRQLELGIAG